MKKRPLKRTKYSPLIVNLMGQLISRKMSDREIHNFFTMFTETINPFMMDTYPASIYDASSGSSKQTRVEEVLNTVLESSDNEKYFEIIVSKAIRKMGTDWLKSQEDGKKLLGQLNVVGFPWELLFENDEIVEGFKIPERVCYTKAALQHRSYKMTLHHLEEALSSLSSGNYSAANGQIRTLFEAFYIELMQDIKKSTCKGGGCRKDFADAYCSPKENEALKTFAELLHEKGAHPGRGEKHEAEFRLITAISWILYSLELSK